MWCRRARRHSDRRGAASRAGQLDDRADHRHPVRPAEQCVRRIMLGHFGFQRRTVGDVGRVGDEEVDAAVEFGQQSRLRSRRPGPARPACLPHCGARRPGPLRSRRRRRPRRRPVLGQRQRERTRSGAQVDDHGMHENDWARAHSSSDSVSGRGMNTPGPTRTVTGPNAAVPVRCCRGIALGALRHQPVIAVEEFRSGVGERQPTTVGARHMRGQQFGIDAR